MISLFILLFTYGIPLRKPLKVSECQVEKEQVNSHTYEIKVLGRVGDTDERLAVDETRMRIAI